MGRLTFTFSVAIVGLAVFVPSVPVTAAPPPYENADVDQSGNVNSGDLGLVALGTHPRSDVNRDGKINSGDMGFVAASYGPLLRDKRKQPFASNSFWNMPIGSGAAYGDIGFPVSRDFTVVDTDHWIVASGTDPHLEIIDDEAFWSGPRCSATEPSGIFTRFPSSLVVPDISGGFKPNNAAAILQPDGRTIIQVNALARCVAGGPVYGVPVGSSDIYGLGMSGGHGGSGMSSIGGTIRAGELLASKPIRHALKVNIPCALYCSPLAGPGGGPGWRWPANTSDRYCGGVACGYGGNIHGLQMGSLLALPPEASKTTITASGQTWAAGMETEVGRKLFDAFQNYGGYVVDDLVWNGTAYAVHVERGVVADVRASTGIDIDHTTNYCAGICGAYWRDWHRIWTNLKVVTNNSASTIGGGGTPRQSLIAPIGN